MPCSPAWISGSDISPWPRAISSIASAMSPSVAGAPPPEPVGERPWPAPEPWCRPPGAYPLIRSKARTSDSQSLYSSAETVSPPTLPNTLRTDLRYSIVRRRLSSSDRVSPDRGGSSSRRACFFARLST